MCNSASTSSAMEVDNKEISMMACSANSVAVEVEIIRKKSAVWKWFTKVNKEESICNLCKKKFKCKRACTSSLRRHIEYKHGNGYFADVEAADNKPKGAEIKEEIVKLPSNSARARKITHTIAEMMVSDCQPFSLVNDTGFRKMMKVLEPRYSLPSCTVFSDIVTTMYEKEKRRVEAILKRDLKTTETFAFTTNCWTSRSNENYLSVTVHYLDCDFIIKNFTLKTINVTEQHTDEHINSFLKDTLAEWSLDHSELQTFFITGNASNIVEGIRLSRTWERIPCFAHILQLVIQNAIKPCEELMAILQKFRGIVRYFRSAAANERLKAEQLLQYPDRKELQLINDCETSWNSQYDMLIRLINVRQALDTLLCEPQTPDSITSSEWAAIEEYSNCLKIFKEAIEMLTVENKPTLPRYIATIYGIRDTITNMLDMETYDGGETSYFKENLIVEMEKRFHFTTKNKYLIVGMILDPRIKDRLLPPEKKEEAIDLVHAFAIKYIKFSDEASVAEENVGVSSSSSSSSSSTQSLFAFFKNVAQQEGQTINVLQHQLQTYVNETLVSPDSCILEWWRHNAVRFPILATVARNLFGIPATQAYSERLFSLADSSVTERRMSLLSEKLEEMCFISANRKT